MLAFVSDTHLRYCLFKYLPDLHGDSVDSLHFIVETILARKASVVLFGGDVFDGGNPDPDVVQIFLDEMRLLETAGIKCLSIQGQHDKLGGQPWYNLDRHVWDLAAMTGDLTGGKLSKPLETPPFVVAGFNACGPSELRTRLEVLDPSVNVLVLHQTLKGSMPEIVGKENWDLDPAWVKPSVRLVLLGHVHKPYEAVVGQTKYVYGGSTVLCAIDEPPAKSFLLVHDDFKLEHVPIPTRPLLAVRVEAPEQLATVVDAVKAAAPGTLVVVRFSPAVPDVEARLRGANDKCAFTFRLTVPEAAEARTVLASAAASLESCLGQLVDRAKEPELYGLLLAALNAQNPKEALAGFKKRFLEPQKEAV